MAHESSLKDTSSIQVDGESSDSSFEIKIKTLDLQTYSFRVNKNMPISALKEEIVTKIGVPLGKQRLLYKGKVLKDNQLLSEHNLTDGDTMHLAERRPVQSQPISSTVAAETSRSSSRRGAGAGSSQNPSRTRSTGAVNVGFIFQNRPAPSLRFVESPWRISNGDELFHYTLTTISDFIDRMTGEFQSCCNSLNNDQIQLLSPNRITETWNSVSETLPTLESMTIILRRTAQLLRENATTALSNLSAHLQRIDSTNDQVLRGQTQFVATQLGLAIQHMGAMFLELGRVTMSLRIGRRTGESFVQAERAVYISPTGPNPIMVEQFPRESVHPFGVPRPFHYRREESVPVASAYQISGSALRTGPPSGSISVPTHEGQETARRTQSDIGNDGTSPSDIDVSRQVEQEVNLDRSEPRNFFGEFLVDTVNQYGEQNVYADIIELSNVEFANEFMEFLRSYIRRRQAWEPFYS